MTSAAIVGKAPEQLTLDERRALAGNWIALEIYTPATMPLKRIAAIGRTPSDCAAELRQSGLDPLEFEFVRVAAIA